MRIVVDTNVLVSGIFWRGFPRRVLDLWGKALIEVLISESVLTEYVRVIERLSIQEGRPEVAEEWERFITENAVVVDAPSLSTICRDSDDNKFIDCAVAGKASYLVSGDKDLLDLKEAFGVPIISPSRFLKKVGLKSS